ncbi:MAG: hypothetical protein J5685_04720, partial [Clostridiales bacterium]|nr:hypothetical protein [Clostridiales bacterium]
YFYSLDRNDVSQSIITFDFPLTLTMDDLLANCGEPDEQRHTDSDSNPDIYLDTWKYKTESTIYLHGSSYEFDFSSSVLSAIWMEYMPG